MRARVLAVGLVVVAMLLVVRVGVAPAETCPAVSPTDTRRAAEQAVAWFGVNQRPEGTWAYRVDESGRDLGGYNITRHAGVLLSLYQADAAGIGGALPVADRGLAWALDQVEPAGDGRAFGSGPILSTGATALLAAALVERREATGDSRYDGVLAALTAFLAGTVEDTGAVPAEWDTRVDRAVPRHYSKYSTGEVFWVLARVDDPAVAAVAAYLPGRDDVEDRFPPTSDHWAAYGWAELASSGTDLTDEQLAYARRLAGIVGVEVRTESTRWTAGAPVRWIRHGPGSGAGIGTLGEGGAALLRLFGMADAPDGLAERVACVAGMLVARQAQGPGPAQRGAWFADGTTRMDDQQHALSALLASGPALAEVAGGGGRRVGGGEDPWGLVTIAVALLAAANPARHGRAAMSTAACGLAYGGVVALAALSGPIADLLSISPASVRVAAGLALAVASIVSLASPRGGWSDGIALTAVGLVTLAAGLDSGVLAVGVGAAPVAVAACWLPDGWRRPLVARLVAGLGLVVAIGLGVDGALAV